MDLFEAHALGVPLAIVHPIGGTRVLAEVFRHPAGLAFADVGWPEPGRHPFHVVAGPIEGDGPPWTVGEARVIKAVDDDRAFLDWLDWHALRRNQWRDADRAACALAMREAGLLVTG